MIIQKAFALHVTSLYLSTAIVPFTEAEGFEINKKNKQNIQINSKSFSNCFVGTEHTLEEGHLECWVENRWYRNQSSWESV